ncbi:acyltransferase [Gordonia sp. C13]|uniref:acyltransferase n=1 Tax=Gordonia sp. C13 TaxID=2935078 RepID=UPI00200A92EA|nr:acyltransferase [Gordonia sp. C13]MCK8614342.1 acyltransferase [Gordonia sp. C13]
MHAASSARTADTETSTSADSDITTGIAPATPPPTSAPVPTPRSRAHTADFVRVFLFTFVVVAHSVNAINGGPDEVRGANLVGTLCHLTRYGFVAVTLYVLVLSMQGREMSPVQFWRRRFGLVIGPYLAWTVIYAITDHIVIRDNPFPPTGEWFSGLAHDLLVGEGKYQLYFLLISMQIYLFFPLIAWIFERGRNRPWLLLSGGALIQITMFVIYQYLPRPSGAAWDVTYHHLWKTLPMYALFVAMGVVAAQHQQAVDKWLREHMATVVLVAAGCAAFTVAGYLLATSPGNVPWKANTAWNPVSLPWLVGGFVLLWLIGLVWDDRRAAGRPAAAKFVSQATLRAFGVFAVHPLILDVLGRVGFLSGLFEWFPHSAILRSLILIAVVLTSSLIVVDLLLRLPFSKWLTARPRIPLLPKREKKQDRAVAAETS